MKDDDEPIATDADLERHRLAAIRSALRAPRTLEGLKEAVIRQREADERDSHSKKAERVFARAAANVDATLRNLDDAIPRIPLSEQGAQDTPVGTVPEERVRAVVLELERQREQLSSQIDAHTKSASGWERQARAEIRAGHDGLAREALARRRGDLAAAASLGHELRMVRVMREELEPLLEEIELLRLVDERT